MELQSEELVTFQRREWAVQKAGTLALCAVILAAILGLLGAGPVATATRSSQNRLVSVEFDRFARFEADQSMTITFAPEAVEDGTIMLELTGPWIAGVDLQGITPEPSEQTAVPGGIALAFQAEPSTRAEVSLSFAAREHLMLEGRATARDDTVSFALFVLP